MYPSLKTLNKYLDVAAMMLIIQRIEGEIENQYSESSISSSSGSLLLGRIGT